MIKENLTMKPIFIVILSLFMFSCQKICSNSPATRQESNTFVSKKKTLQPYTVIYNDYNFIVQNLKDQGKKSKYYKKNYIDTLALMSPDFFAKVLVDKLNINKDLGIDTDNILRELAKYQNKADSVQVKYTKLKDIIDNREYFNIAFGKLVNDEKITERILKVTIYDNNAIFNIHSPNWNVGYWVTLKKNTLKIVETSYIEEGPSTEKN